MSARESLVVWFRSNSATREKVSDTFFKNVSEKRCQTPFLVLARRADPSDGTLDERFAAR